MRKIISLSCFILFAMFDALEACKRIFLKSVFRTKSLYFSGSKKLSHSLSHTALTTQKIHNLPIFFHQPLWQFFVTDVSVTHFCALCLSTFIFPFLSLLFAPSGYFCQVKYSNVIAKVTPLYMLAATQLCFSVIFKKKRHFFMLWLLTGITIGLLLLLFFFAIW